CRCVVGTDGRAGSAVRCGRWATSTIRAPDAEPRPAAGAPCAAVAVPRAAEMRATRPTVAAVRERCLGTMPPLVLDQLLGAGELHHDWSGWLRSSHWMTGVPSFRFAARTPNTLLEFTLTKTVQLPDTGLSLKVHSWSVLAPGA